MSDIDARKVNGFTIFRLELHLPYLLLKESPDDRETDEQGKKLWDDLSFLPLKLDVDERQCRCSIYEAQTTISIAGAHHFDWHGYAFGNPGPTDPRADEDDGNDDEEPPEEFFEEEEDFFAAGGCEPVGNPDQIVWDPRIYFLRTLQLRLAIVVRANEHLVQTLVEGVKDWVGTVVLWDTAGTLLTHLSGNPRKSASGKEPGIGCHPGAGQRIATIVRRDRPHDEALSTSERTLFQSQCSLEEFQQPKRRRKVLHGPPRK